MAGNSEIIDIIDQKADHTDEVALKVVENPELLHIILEGLSAEIPRVKFRSAKILRIISEEDPDLLYPKIDVFLELLDTDNSIILWNDLDIIANLTSVDDVHRFDEVYEKYYHFLEDASMVTAAHVVDNSAKIALNRPDLQDKITEKLLKVYETPLGTECRDILSGKVLLAFTKYFDVIKNKDEVISFAEKQRDSKRNSTKVKAEKFLKKFKD